MQIKELSGKYFLRKGDTWGNFTPWMAWFSAPPILASMSLFALNTYFGNALYGPFGQGYYFLLYPILIGAILCFVGLLYPAISGIAGGIVAFPLVEDILNGFYGFFAGTGPVVGIFCCIGIFAASVVLGRRIKVSKFCTKCGTPIQS